MPALRIKRSVDSFKELESLCELDAAATRRVEVPDAGPSVASSAVPWFSQAATQRFPLPSLLYAPHRRGSIRKHLPPECAAGPTRPSVDEIGRARPMQGTLERGQGVVLGL